MSRIEHSFPSNSSQQSSPVLNSKIAASEQNPRHSPLSDSAEVGFISAKKPAAIASPPYTYGDTAPAEHDRASLQAGIQARRNIWMASRRPATLSAPSTAGAPLPGVLLL